MAARGGRANFFDFFRMLWYEQFFFGDAELFSPSMIGYFSKDFSQLSTTGHLVSIFYV